MDSEFQAKDTFMMSDSLHGRLDEKTFLGDEDAGEGLTVSISPHGGSFLKKNIVSLIRTAGIWEISYRATPREVIQSSLFTSVDFSIHDSSDRGFSITESNRRIISLEADFDCPGSYICKLVLEIE